MSSQDLPKPDFAMNMKLIGHSDQGGREDGVQVMVNKGHAFVGHMFSKGFSIIDVRDPRDPKPVKYVPAPHNTWTIHLQTFEDLLLVINARDDMDRAADLYRRLGFTLTERGYHSLGSMNHLAMFGTDYLELIAVPKGATTGRLDLLDYPAGLNGLVFG